MDWMRKVNDLSKCLEGLIVRDEAGNGIETDEGFRLWVERTLDIRSSKGTVFFIGNGASASIASHFAADLAKNAHVRTQVFYDLSLITALGNDMCFEEVFSEPLRLCMSEGDILVAVSSSGQSSNILRGVETALNFGGIVVTLSAMRSENRLRTMGAINFYVPAATYGLAESNHTIILHHWMDYMTEAVTKKSATPLSIAGSTVDLTKPAVVTPLSFESFRNPPETLNEKSPHYTLRK
jgi:D-sedoheptulose 7-phosphate isomerase